MVDSEVETLVCPFCTCPEHGFYVELFLIDAFVLIAIKMEKAVFLIFPVKDIQLAALLQNFKGPKNIYQFLIPSILSRKAKLSMASCTYIM